MSKKDIYAESYTTEPVDNTAALEKMRVKESTTERRKLGLLLQEEKKLNQELKRKNMRLTEDIRRLREVLAVKSRDAHPNPNQQR